MKTEKIFGAIALVILFVFWVPQLGHGEIYKWIDEKGTVHFTEDPSTIPDKYRNKTESRKTEEDYMSPQEKTRAKRIDERKAKERMERSQREYEKSLLEEKRRKAEKDLKNKVEKFQVELEEDRKKQEEAIRRKQREEEREREQYKKCWNCDGKGYISKEVTESHGGVPLAGRTTHIQKECSICGGTGLVKK